MATSSFFHSFFLRIYGGEIVQFQFPLVSQLSFFIIQAKSPRRVVAKLISEPALDNCFALIHGIHDCSIKYCSKRNRYQDQVEVSRYASELLL